jgi:hypothetical protein
MNIYADVTKELKKSEFAGLDDYFKVRQETIHSDQWSKA